MALAQSALATLYETTDRVDLAIEQYKAVAKIPGALAETKGIANMQLGMLYYNRQDYVAARKHWRLAKGQIRDRRLKKNIARSLQIVATKIPVTTSMVIVPLAGIALTSGVAIWLVRKAPRLGTLLAVAAAFKATQNRGRAIAAGNTPGGTVALANTTIPNKALNQSINIMFGLGFFAALDYVLVRKDFSTVRWLSSLLIQLQKQASQPAARSWFS